ncbi:telomere-protecting terminal protein Tpg [Embleya sp. NPDC020886]|uniref:telomere-protecting terminal protein Tpg n=1 Tax=Embleya sp. NPDC020886 TaxID=3363980 RepID=UPI00379CC598
MGKIGDGLDQAAQHVLTRKPPKSTSAPVRFLPGKHQGRTRDVAAVLGVSQRTVERYLKGDRKTPPRAVDARIDAEVRRLWQPQVRRRAEQRAAAAGAVVVETRARFGFSSAAGSTDPRMRRITQPLPPRPRPRAVRRPPRGRLRTRPRMHRCRRPPGRLLPGGRHPGRRPGRGGADRRRLHRLRHPRLNIPARPFTAGALHHV